MCEAVGVLRVENWRRSRGGRLKRWGRRECWFLYADVELPNELQAVTPTPERSSNAARINLVVVLLFMIIPFRLLASLLILRTMLLKRGSCY